jgi:hypothetical protein
MYANLDSILQEENTRWSTKATMLIARQKAFHKHHIQAPRYLAWFTIFLITWRVFCRLKFNARLIQSSFPSRPGTRE